MLVASVLTAIVLLAPALSPAAPFPCGQPVTTGSSPKASDCLAVLKCAVGLEPCPCDARPCACDVTMDGDLSAADALKCLKAAVSPCLIPEGCLPCLCDDFAAACTSVRVELPAGGDLDYGWTGIAHDSLLPAGAATNLDVIGRCTGDGATCSGDDDCDGGFCLSTCDCSVDQACDVAGPVQPKHCVTTLAPCAGNADCPPGVACVALAGPPVPMSSGGTPVCVVSHFEGPVTGTLDTGSGDASLSFSVKARVSLGIQLSMPCPRCGAPEAGPRVGDVFTCEGGQQPGATCTVEGVHPLFGGTSTDCPPQLQTSIMGAGITIPVASLTTGTTTRTASIPCANFAFRGNPTVPDSNPKCTDDPAGPVCASNADCTRCTGDSTIPCSSNADCAGKGACAEAPDQPVSCGFWCHCGFCNDNPALPCFDSSQCPDGQPCARGTGTGTAQNSPQQKPNDCALDGFLCGTNDDERCATTQRGTCSLQPYRSCSSDETCIPNNAGSCVLEPRPCFGHRLERNGSPSPLGSYCAFEDRECVSNADCAGEGDWCLQDSSRPALAGLFCMPATSNSAVNVAQGVTGPAAISLPARVTVCRCGDSLVGCSEDCDDGNAVSGDGCSARCRAE